MPLDYRFNLERQADPVLVVSALLFLFPILSSSFGGYSAPVFKVVALVSLIFCCDNIASTRWEKWLFLGMVAVVIGAAASLIHSQILYDGYKQLGKFAHFLFFIPAYLLIRRRAKLPVLALLGGIILASLIFAVISYQQRYYAPVDAGYHLRDGIVRAQGGINPILFGQLSVLFVFLQIAALFSFWRYSQKWLLIIPILCASFSAYASGTRGALLFFPVAALFLLWAYRANLGRTIILSVFGILLVSVAVIAVTENPLSRMFIAGINEVAVPSSDPYLHQSWGSRAAMWRNSIEIFSNHPVFGTGLGDYQHDMKALVENGFSRSKDPFIYTHHSHSIYFQALAITGGVGLLTLLMGAFVLPAIFFHYGWRRADSPWTRFAALGGTLTVCAYALFGVTGAWTSNHGHTSSYLLLLLPFLAAVGPPDTEAQ